MRAFLLFLAHQEGFKNFMLQFRMFRTTAWRFVAGETLVDAIAAARQINRQGMHGTMDLLGENTQSRKDAERSTMEVMGMLDTISAEGVDCNVSVKLTQLGLDIDPDFCRENLLRIARHAAGLGSFVRVDMEDSNYTQRTLDIVFAAHREIENLGAVIQAYLYRSEEDVRALLKEGIRIRLCKGAYLEPEKVAFKKKRDTDQNYLKLTKMLLQSGIYHGIATHDEAIVKAAKEFAARENISKESFEFQMLFGVRRDLQEQLAREGYNVRIYIPYGARWYPYFMRRLAERPANVLFIARNLFKG